MEYVLTSQQLNILISLNDRCSNTDNEPQQLAAPETSQKGKNEMSREEIARRIQELMDAKEERKKHKKWLVISMYLLAVRVIR